MSVSQNVFNRWNEIKNIKASAALVKLAVITQTDFIARIFNVFLFN